MVSRRILPDLKKLLQAAKADGLTLKVVSGYRSYERQVQVPLVQFPNCSII